MTEHRTWSNNSICGVMDSPSLLAVTDAAVLAPRQRGAGGGSVQGAQEWCRRRTSNCLTNAIGVVVNRAEQDETYRYYRRGPCSGTTSVPLHNTLISQEDNGRLGGSMVKTRR